LAVFHRSEVGVELASQAFDVEQVFCSITSCGWISTWKRREVWNRRSSTRPKEMSFSGRSNTGLAHGADGVLELVHARVGRHPARFQVRLRHALVVALEEGEEVLRQVVLVDVGERAHDAEIDRDVLAARGPVSVETKMLPGCMSAWKKPSRNTW